MHGWLESSAEGFWRRAVYAVLLSRDCSLQVCVGGHDYLVQWLAIEATLKGRSCLPCALVASKTLPKQTHE